MSVPYLSYNELTALEEQIFAYSGRRRLSFYSDATHGYHITTGSRELVKQWLIGCGARKDKIDLASDLVLANAYRAGRSYIEKLNRDNPKGNIGKKPGSSLGIELPDSLVDLLSAPISQTDQTTNPVLIDKEKIAAAADAVIAPRINAALKTLTDQLAGAIKLAAQKEVGELKTDLFDSLSGLAADLRSSVKTELQTIAHQTATSVAETVARRLIEENLPRRLLIETPNKSTKILGAQPRHKIFDKVLKRLLIGRHVYMVGGAGTGKTHLSDQLAEGLGRPITKFAQLFTKYDLSGYRSPTGQMIDTPLRAAVEEGHLTFFDEIDMSQAAAIGFLNSLTSNRYVAFPDKLVEAHPDFVVLAAANTTGHGATQQFVGRNPLDAASLDRFVYVECDYDEALERQIYGSSPWVIYCHRVRAACRELKNPHIISMRAIERCLDGQRLGDSAPEIAYDGLWRNLAPDTISKIMSIAGDPPERRQPVDYSPGLQLVQGND